MNLSKAANVSIVLFFTGVVLIYGQTFLIPFVLAVFIWFIIREIKKFFRRSKYFRLFLPNWLENLLASLFFFAFITFFVSLLAANIESLSANLSVYQTNISKIADKLNSFFNINIMKQINDISGGMKFTDILGSVINAVSGLLGNVFIIIIYVLFLFLEELGFQDKLKAMLAHSPQGSSVFSIIDKIDHSIGRDLVLKTIVSLLTGILSFIALKIIGVDAAVFWAFLIFIMNFIPNIGSLIATLFPAVFALLQFGDFAPAIWVLIVVAAVQLVVGNIVEPKVMGNSLNLSSLVVILALSLWGALWGITGMVLSVPITVVMLIVFSEFPATKPLAILLSEKGNID
jgi:predicted PurR-regulated permease PerM